MALLAAVPLALSVTAGAQTLARDFGYRLPDEYGEPADTLDGPVTDYWFARDKAYHVGASFGLALGAHVALKDGMGMEPELSVPLAAGFALGIGLAKEVADSRRVYKPLFSWRDLTADAAGVALALAIANL